jgi:hypothetical protein
MKMRIRIMMKTTHPTTIPIIAEELIKKWNLNYIPKETKISVVDGSVTNSIGYTENLEVVLHGSITRMRLMVLPTNGIDVLLGLDWFKATMAILDPTNQILKFPSKQVCLKDDFDFESS